MGARVRQAEKKTFQEDWSPRGFYKTMCVLFRPLVNVDGKVFRHDPKDKDEYVEPPFYVNRPLSKKEFFGACQLYKQARGADHLLRVLARPQRMSPASRASDKDPWPDLQGLVSPEEFWKFQKALGQLYFAETSGQDSQARRVIEDLAQDGPPERRKLLRRARTATLQAKRSISGMELTFKLIPYRSERQFIWNFLYREACAVQEGQWVARHTSQIAKTLAIEYSYLNLTPRKIESGLRDRRYTADRDTAKEFHLSALTVRSMLSKFYR